MREKKAQDETGKLAGDWPSVEVVGAGWEEILLRTWNRKISGFNLLSKRSLANRRKNELCKNGESQLEMEIRDYSPN